MRSTTIYKEYGREMVDQKETVKGNKTRRWGVNGG
jgi:hypothetical protein